MLALCSENTEHTIDGAQGEGGGQILRTATAISSLFGNFLKIHSIRAGRSVQGLRNQHMVGVDLLAKLSNAETTGVEVKST